MRRTVAASLLELVGVALTLAGFWMVAPWLALVVGGVCAVALGVAVERGGGDAGTVGSPLRGP
jgi:hypothetical protein